jgi:hypothetical protein
MRRKHYWASLGHIGDVVNKNHTQRPKSIYDNFVMNDLVIAVDGRLKGSHHPSQSFDRHFDAGTETTW